MKKGQMLEGTVERIDYPNKGVVKAEGADRPVVVKNAIPGQKVRVSVNKMRKGTGGKEECWRCWSPRLWKSHPPVPISGSAGDAPIRPCPMRSSCGSRSPQVKGLLDEAIQKGGGHDYQWDGIKASPRTDAYRNKMEFTFGDEYKGGPPWL